MKLNVSFTPDLVALMRAEVAAGQKAVSTTMAQSGTSLKSAWRAQITGAGLGHRGRDRLLASRYLGAHQYYEVGGEADIQFHGVLVFSVQISRSRSSFGSP